MTSRRGRLERGAMRDLYVLVEAFGASPPEYLDEMRRLVPEAYGEVEGLLPGLRPVARPTGRQGLHVAP